MLLTLDKLIIDLVWTDSLDGFTNGHIKCLRWSDTRGRAKKLEDFECSIGCRYITASSEKYRTKSPYFNFHDIKRH